MGEGRDEIQGEEWRIHRNQWLGFEEIKPQILVP